MNADRARALAETLHEGQTEPGGAPLIDHIRRVAATVPGEARVVAWLHDVLEHSSVPEQELLSRGLSHDELRAIRLLTRDTRSRSNKRYLAHVERIARAGGAGADIARCVKRADLADRTLNPPAPRDLWSPPYELGLGLLQGGAGSRSPTQPLAASQNKGRQPTIRSQPLTAEGR